MSEHIPLTRAPRELLNAGYRPGTSYGRIYVACVNGQFPAEQGLNSRWTIRRADLDTVAAALGLRRANIMEPAAA